MDDTQVSAHTQSVGCDRNVLQGAGDLCLSTCAHNTPSACAPAALASPPGATCWLPLPLLLSLLPHYPLKLGSHCRWRRVRGAAGAPP